MIEPELRIGARDADGVALTEQEQAGYEFEKGRQRHLDERKRRRDIGWGIVLLLATIWWWFAFASPSAQRDARDRREFHQRMDAIAEQANR